MQALEEYIRENLNADGYAATYAIHDDGRGNNPHAHILVANRQIDPATGGWARLKQRMEYVRDERGERVPLIDPETGRQKTDKRGRRQWKRTSVSLNPLDRKAKLKARENDLMARRRERERRARTKRLIEVGAMAESAAGFEGGDERAKERIARLVQLGSLVEAMCSTDVMDNYTSREDLKTTVTKALEHNIRTSDGMNWNLHDLVYEALSEEWGRRDGEISDLWADDGPSGEPDAGLPKHPPMA